MSSIYKYTYTVYVYAVDIFLKSPHFLPNLPWEKEVWLVSHIPNQTFSIANIFSLMCFERTKGRQDKKMLFY